MTTIRDCFFFAEHDEKQGKKHKGLLIVGKNDGKAEEFLQKAKTNLLSCDLYCENGLDFKIPEEWFYSQYYCALAILAKFGVESRSQKCTALFLKYVKEKGLINYDDEFIDRITVYSDKNTTSDVDERENARYSSLIKMRDIMKKYDFMMNLCKKCIDQCEAIVYSNKEFEVPKELNC